MDFIFEDLVGIGAEKTEKANISDRPERKIRLHLEIAANALVEAERKNRLSPEKVVPRL